MKLSKGKIWNCWDSTITVLKELVISRYVYMYRLESAKQIWKTEGVFCEFNYIINACWFHWFCWFQCTVKFPFWIFLLQLKIRAIRWVPYRIKTMWGRCYKIQPLQTLIGLEYLYIVDGFNSSLQKMSVHVPLMTGYFNKHSLKYLAKDCQSWKFNCSIECQN